MFSKYILLYKIFMYNIQVIQKYIVCIEFYDRFVLFTVTKKFTLVALDCNAFWVARRTGTFFNLCFQKKEKENIGH